MSLDLNDVLYDWLEIADAATLWIAGDQSANFPFPQNEPLVGVYKFQATSQQMIDYAAGTFNLLNDNFDFRTESMVQATYSVDVFSFDVPQTALVVASKVIASLADPRVVELFYTNKIGYSGHEAIQDLTALESAQVKKRLKVNVNFNVNLSLLSTVDRIDSVPLDQAVTTDGGTVYNDNYTVES